MRLSKPASVSHSAIMHATHGDFDSQAGHKKDRSQKGCSRTHRAQHPRKRWIQILIASMTCFGSSLPLYAQSPTAIETAPIATVFESPNSAATVSNAVYVNSVSTSAAVVTASANAPTAAQAPAPFDFSNDPSWIAQIEAAQKNLSPERLPDAAKAKAKLQSAMHALESFLASSAQHGSNWKTFLKWETLSAELAKPAPSLGVLQEIEKIYRQNYFGLEMQPFTAVRDSLLEFIHAQRFGAEPTKTMEILRNRLNKLSERLKTPGLLNDAEGMHEVAQTISYLAQGNQAPELVQAFQKVFSKSNARVLVSSEFLQRKFSRPVDQSNPVNELILGTTIVGDSFLHGMVTPTLVPNSNMAQLQLNFHADFSSMNTGYNRSVVICSTGSAGITACESVALTTSGLSSLGNTFADANLVTNITGINHNSKLVRKIAQKQVAKKKPEADAISESRLENRLRNQFHEQLGEQLAEANSKLNNPKDNAILNRLGLTKPARSSWSTNDQLAVLWNVANGVQLGAISSCPLVVDPSGLTIQVHQSVVGNLLDPILAGRVLRSEEIDSYVAQFGDLGKNVQRKKDEIPWWITFNGFQPVEIQLDDSRVRFRIRIARLDREDQSLTNPATVEATYQIELKDGKIQLVRDGDIKLDFQGSQSGTKTVTLRALLKSKFEDLFKPQLLDQPLDIKEKLPEQLKDLQVASITIDDGWLQAHVK